MTTPTSLSTERVSRRSFVARDVVAVAGISYRQLDYWTRTGLVQASGHPTTGSGDTCWYRDTDVLRIACIAALLNGGVAFDDIKSNIDTYIETGQIQRGTVTIALDVARIREHVNANRRAS